MESGQPPSQEPTVKPSETAPTAESVESKVTSKKTSVAWDNFEKMNMNRARCKHCKQEVSYKSGKTSNTSTMLNHMRRCKKMHPEPQVEVVGSKRVRQSTLHRSKKAQNDEGDGVQSFLPYDYGDCRNSLVRMIIKDELPFRIVEREGFREFIYVLQPRFDIPSRRTVTRDCLSLFFEEKKKLKMLFQKHKGSVCLTTDTWTSIQNINYMCLTAHYVDENWNLKKKIINFCQILSHKGELIGKMVERCLVSWGISSVFTITVDNASANDVGIRFLRRRLKSWGTSILDGEYLHMRCGAHILNLVVRDGLEENKATISRIRSAVKYVKSSPARENKFRECLLHLKLSPTAGLCLDVETRWNSTYLMLESALKLKRGFDMLAEEDDKYAIELGKLDGVPTQSDWEYATAYTPILKFFYDATLKVSATRFVTGNAYLKEIFGVGWMIRKMGLNKTDPNQKAMANRMKAKFDKYWGDMENMNVMVFVACVVDPRYKLKHVSFIIRESYGVGENSIAEALIAKINLVLEKMFMHYKAKLSNDSVHSNQAQGAVNLDSHVVEEAEDTYDLDSLIDIHEESEETNVHQTELESYLTDPCAPRDPNFDILQWWKKSALKYKTLSLMARDLMAIPVSTVASESAFSTGGRVIDPFRSSLTPRTVEALICTQDWIRHDYDQSSLEEQLESLQILEEEIVASNTYGNLVQGVSLPLEEE